MAEIIVRNNLNPHKAVRFNVALRKFVSSTEETAEEKYFIEVGTTYSGIYKENDTATYSGINKIDIRPAYLDGTSKRNITEEMSYLVGYLSSYVDWGELLTDEAAPYVTQANPVGEDVSIFTNVEFIIKDDIPTTGIDLSEMNIVLNNGVVDFDITPELKISGNPMKYKISWAPKIREFNKVE